MLSQDVCDMGEVEVARQTERQRETEKQKDKETETERERERERAETDRHTCLHKDRLRDKEKQRD